MVGSYGCFVVVVDPHRGAIEWSSKIPEIPHKDSLKDSARSFATALLAVDRRDWKFAVLVNNEVMKEPEVFLYNARSSAPLLHWRLPRFAQSAAWSPDGKKLVVLYSGLCDSRLTYYWQGLKRGGPPLALPDVAVFDARTGHLDYSFFSGQPEAQISYGPDGKSLYCVVDSGALPITFLSHHARDAIRVFSATDGKLMRAIHVPRTGVRSSLVFSPNGKLIVADASTFQSDLFRDPGDVGRNVRFVILGRTSGRRLLTRGLGVWHSVASPSFLFSPDGHMLFVDPNPNSTGEGPVKMFRLMETQ